MSEMIEGAFHIAVPRVDAGAVGIPHDLREEQGGKDVEPNVSKGNEGWVGAVDWTKGLKAAVGDHQVVAVVCSHFCVEEIRWGGEERLALEFPDHVWQLKAEKSELGAEVKCIWSIEGRDAVGQVRETAKGGGWRWSLPIAIRVVVGGGLAVEVHVVHLPDVSVCGPRDHEGRRAGIGRFWKDFDQLVGVAGEEAVNRVVVALAGRWGENVDEVGGGEVGAPDLGVNPRPEDGEEAVFAVVEFADLRGCVTVRGADIDDEDREGSVLPCDHVPLEMEIGGAMARHIDGDLFDPGDECVVSAQTQVRMEERVHGVFLRLEADVEDAVRLIECSDEEKPDRLGQETGLIVTREVESRNEKDLIGFEADALLMRTSNGVAEVDGEDVGIEVGREQIGHPVEAGEGSENLDLLLVDFGDGQVFVVSHAVVAQGFFDSCALNVTGVAGVHGGRKMMMKMRRQSEGKKF